MTPFFQASRCSLAQGRIHVWSESAPAPFWQINHANSAYFRSFLGYFRVISTTQPPLLDLGTPLFTYPGSAPALAYQFTLNEALVWPPFSIFRKFVHFQPCFGQSSSSLDQNFSKFLFPRSPFFKENPLPRPYILKPAWHTSTRKKLSALTGVVLWTSLHCHIWFLYEKKHLSTNMQYWSRDS